MWLDIDAQTCRVSFHISHSCLRLIIYSILDCAQFAIIWGAYVKVVSSTNYRNNTGAPKFIMFMHTLCMVYQSRLDVSAMCACDGCARESFQQQNVKSMVGWSWLAEDEWAAGSSACQLIELICTCMCMSGNDLHTNCKWFYITNILTTYWIRFQASVLSCN